ncbi:MAG: tetraacyldisaccharide 4'-kinase [Candidatus Gastranaerophilales bacterium]|nr:tetraacyldisaccharide 4'-kinase [Candidatus Gastranaerophilales bacterium]
MAGFLKEITKFHYKGLRGLNSFWGRVFGILFFLPLLLASLFYFLGISFKNLLYKTGFLKEASIKAGVICIGNLTTGGVGKTPVTIEFCKYLSKKYKVSSLSRGYGGKLKGANIIRDFDNILIDDVELIGDEVKLIANSSCGSENFAVITSSNRVAGAKKAIEELGVEVIVMDDGFSNRKIAKTLSLLLFDVSKFVGNGGVLPFGPLREPLCELNRADGVIIIDKENSSEAEFENLKEILSVRYGFKGKIFEARMAPDYLYNIKTLEKIDKAKTACPFAFCGIGQPESFYKYLSKELAGFNPSSVMSFNDHHAYTKADIENISSAAKKFGADCLVTTEKDAAKISELIEDNQIPVFALKLCVDIDVEKILDELGFKCKMTAGSEE